MKSPINKNLEAATDHELVEAWQKSNDGEAISALFLRYEKKFHEYFTRKTIGRAIDHTELMGELSIILVSQLHTFKMESPFEHWLKKIASNLVIQSMKKEMTKQDHHEEYQKLMRQKQIQGIDLDSITELHHCIDALPKEERAIILMKHIDGKTFKEIEDSPFIKFSAQRAQQIESQAKDKLKKCLESA